MTDNGRHLVMLVDDHEHLLVTLRDYLLFEKFDVVTAVSAEKALELLTHRKPDIIVLDISMPGMGGLGFLKEITEPNGRTKYPVLVFTARSAMEGFFKTVTVDGFIAKPCLESEILKEIRRILSKHDCPARPKVHGKTLLLGEDDPRLREVLKRSMGGAGYVVEVASSGPEVIERAATLRPDGILLKEVLPRMNGSVVVSIVRAMESVRSIPVVLYDDTQTVGGRMGGEVTKPSGVTAFVASSDPAMLLDAVRKAFAG